MNFRFFSLALLLSFSVSSHAQPAIFCEDDSGPTWAMCADSGYPPEQHRSPLPGTSAAGGFTCSTTAAGVQRCTYPASFAEGSGWVPPPPVVKPVSSTKPLFELVGNYVDTFVADLGNGIKALFQASERPVSDSLGSAGATQSALPSSITRTVKSGDVSLTIPATTIAGVSYPAQTVTGPMGDVFDALGKLSPGSVPSSFYTGNTGALSGFIGTRSIEYQSTCVTSTGYTGFAVTNGNYYPTGSVSTANAPCVRVNYTYGSTQSVATFPLSNPSLSNCASGYSPDPNKPGSCIVSDVTAAKAAQAAGELPDGVCTVNSTGVRLSDPDCATAVSSGTVRIQVNAAGVPVTVATNPTTKTTVAVTHSEPQTLSRTQVAADGSATREDAQIPSRAPVSPTTQTFQPLSPPPAYPGDLNSGNPSAGGPSGNLCGSPGQPPCNFAGLDGLRSSIDSLKSGQCGAPGQSPCSIQGMDELSTAIDALSDAVSDATSGPDLTGAPVGEGLSDAASDAATPTALDGLMGSVLDLSRFTPVPPGYSCTDALSLSDASTSVDYLGESLSLDLPVSSLCPLIEPRESTILASTSVLWSIFALLLFVRLTV